MREMGQSAWLSTSYLLYRAQREESMRGRQEIVCNDWISWGNNYSVWPPRIEALEKLPGRSCRHKTTPVLCSKSFLEAADPISVREYFEGPHVWPNGRTLLRMLKKTRLLTRPPGVARTESSAWNALDQAKAKE